MGENNKCIHCNKRLEKELNHYEAIKVGADHYKYKCPFCGTYFSKEEFGDEE